MLKLLNGDDLTAQDKQAFKNNNTRAYLLNNDYTLSQDNYIQSIDFKDERYNEEKGTFIGEAICKSIDVKLVNQDNNLDLENEDLEYRVGAKVGNTYKYISFGNFIVQKPDNEEVNEQTTFQALDYMCKFNVPYTQRLTLPMSLGDLAADICDQCGVTLGTTTFRNSTKTIANNPFINGEQCREVIKSIAKVSFSVAYINQDNELCFGFNLKTTADETITTDEYFELEPNKETKPISVIVLRSGEIPANGRRIVDNDLIALYGENELIIEEDYFAYTDSLRDEFLVAARSLMGLTYKPVSIDLLGSIYLEFNDVLQITNLKSEVIKTYCLNNIHTYNGTLYNTISSPALTEAEETYKYQEEDKTGRTKTFANIDKANKRIDLAVEQLNTQQQTLTNLGITVGQIEASVEDIIDPLSEKSTATSTITITDATEGDVYELHIIGNNELFGGLYPSTNLYPSTTLYPQGAVSILRVRHRENELEEYEEDVYNLGVEAILRQITIGGKEYYDEYVISEGTAKIIKRVKSDGSGILDNEVITNLGSKNIKLYKGENIITLDTYAATIYLTYIRETEYGQIYATKIEVNSSIEVAKGEIELQVSQKADKEEVQSSINLLKNEIDIEVNQKVDEDEIIAKINAAVQEGQGIITIQGNKLIIDTDYTKLDANGKFTTTAGKIGKWNLSEDGVLWGEAYLDNTTYQSGLDTRNGSILLYAGIDVGDGQTHYLSEANAYITKSGKMYAKIFDVNGENGRLSINYEDGKRAMVYDITGFTRYLDNENNNLFMSLYNTDTGTYLQLFDSPTFAVVDGVHSQTLLLVNRYRPEAGINAASIYLYPTTYYYAGTGTGYEIATKNDLLSDENIKKNINKTNEKALDIIDKMNFVEFDWDKEKIDKQGHVNIGLIAQELEELNENYINKTNIVKDNSSQELYTINVLNLLTTATKGIQELNELVKKQQNLIDNLTNRIKELEEKIND